MSFQLSSHLYLLRCLKVCMFIYIGDYKTAKPKSIIHCWFLSHATSNVEPCRSESVLALTSNVIEAFPRDLQWWTPFDRGWDVGPCSCRCHDYCSWLSWHGPPSQYHSCPISCDLHSLHRSYTLHLQQSLLKLLAVQVYNNVPKLKRFLPTMGLYTIPAHNGFVYLFKHGL